MLRNPSQKYASNIQSLIQQNVSLADKNWFATGGSAKFFCQPQTNQQFQEALIFANKQNLPLFILGNGANILISDEGFDGLVIRPHLKELSIEPFDENHRVVTAGAGVQLDDLIEFCLTSGLSGLEEFSGIPGTVGGAVYINLHYFEFLLEQFLISAQVIEKDTGTIKKVDPQWLDFGYNQSTLLKEAHFLLSATFKLKKINENQVAFARGRKKEIIRHRAARYPQKGTCGSFFRNFHEHEVTIESNGKKMIYVAYYLDKIGVKGALQIGDAIVSHQHANMIVNRGNATTNDIIQVARTMQKLVKDQFGILPQPECRLIGFKEYPLSQ
jgi:UDP-N-acetylmuramate dehydrogenase